MDQLSEFQRRLRELDLELARLMVRPNPKHHSTGDWNFKETNWILDSTQYVSAPSSMKFTTDTNNCLIKTTTVPINQVKEGRFVSQVRPKLAAGRTEIAFRYQDVDNYYGVLLACTTGTHAVIRRYGAVTTTLRSGTNNVIPLATWTKVRVTWWNDYVGLVIRFEYWDGSAWQLILADTYDSLNYWKTTGGRIGMGRFTAAIDAEDWNWDDTEIYGIDP